MSYEVGSPDLSPTEYIWDMIGRRVRQRQRLPTTLAELGQELQEEWNRLPQGDIAPSQVIARSEFEVHRQMYTE